MTPDEFAADKARRIAANIVEGTQAVVALLAEGDQGLITTVRLMAIVNYHDSVTISIMLEPPPPPPGTVVREVRRFDVGQGPISVAIRNRKVSDD